MESRLLVSTKSAGFSTGDVFDGRSSVPDIRHAVIRKIVFGHATFLHSVMVHYGSEGTRHGASGYTQTEAVLDSGEFITSIRGNYAGNAISELWLESNKGKKWGPYGTWSDGSTDSTFCWTAPSDDMGLLYLSGKADTTYIRELKATWALYSSLDANLPTSVNYEEQTRHGSSPSQAMISRFGRHLMSSVVTLVAGEQGVEFHACENALCTLPFFSAAFQGGFKEASEKRITMPEDDPEIVAALIEFLYNGTYTYPYDPQTTERSDKLVGTTVLPIGDTREGEFHVRVYAIASKYSCEPLVQAAVKNFIYISLQLKGMDIIRHWKTAYEHGLLLSDWEDDKALACFKTGLARFLKQLYLAHREEMDTTFEEYPALGADFLRVAVCSGMEA